MRDSFVVVTSPGWLGHNYLIVLNLQRSLGAVHCELLRADWIALDMMRRVIWASDLIVAGATQSALGCAWHLALSTLLDVCAEPLWRI